MFLGLWPASSPALRRPVQQSRARRLPSSSSERSCHWECRVWFGFGSQTERTDRKSSFFNRQQSLSLLYLFMSQWCCYIHIRHSSSIIWCNIASDHVVCRTIWVNYLLICSMAADKYYACSPIVRERSTCWTLSFILLHCLWLSRASTFFHLSLQPLALSASPCLCSGSPRSLWQNSINISWQAGMP